MFGKLLSVLRWVWSFLCKLAEILNHARFSLLVVLLAGAALVLNDQAQDILVGLSLAQVPLFFIAVVWWALQGWGWARYVLEIVYPGRGQPGAQRWLINWVPRTLGMLAFVFAIAGAWMAEARTSLIIGLIVSAVLFLAYLIRRRRIAATRYGLVSKQKPADLIRVTLGIVVLAFIAGVAAPIAMGQALGAGAVAFLGLGCIVAAGSWLVTLAVKTRIPVVTLLFAAAVVFSLTNDNHAIRIVEDGNGNDQAAVAPLMLADAFGDWRGQAVADGGEIPLVVVATAGGGLRASFWTDVVLGYLEDNVPDFHRNVFAISGVSGGSLGAVFYNAALAARPACSGAGPCFGDRLLRANDQDFLGPTVTATLYGDLAQRFLPFPLFRDRAWALETAWERGFDVTFPDAVCDLTTPLRELRSANCAGENSWLPLLLLNGTYVEAGRRVLTSEAAISREVFLDTSDFHQLNGARAIRASTAAHNSARFSYVSPAGRFSNADGQGSGHIVDGGYFENYGAESLNDLLHALPGLDGSTNFRYRLIVIAISNDPRIPLSQYVNGGEPGVPDNKEFLSEVLAPLNALLATRTARGIQAFKSLARSTTAICETDTRCTGETFVHFYLDGDEDSNAPLGWVLSKDAQRDIASRLSSDWNCGELARLDAALGRGTSGCE